MYRHPNSNIANALDPGNLKLLEHPHVSGVNPHRLTLLKIVGHNFAVQFESKPGKHRQFLQQKAIASKYSCPKRSWNPTLRTTPGVEHKKVVSMEHVSSIHRTSAGKIRPGTRVANANDPRSI
jgi:hypothetical protein